MRRSFCALLVALALVARVDAFLVGGLKFTNGVSQYVQAQASTAANNMGTLTVAIWASLTTVAPAAQRNFYAKATGGSAVVGFINGTGLTAQYGDTTSARAITSFANLPTLTANLPTFWVFQNDATVAGNNLLAIGTLTSPAVFATTYTTQTAASGGTHNDSGSAFVLANGGGLGTTNTLPGTIYSVQVFNRILSQDEVRTIQYRWMPGYRGCVIQWRTGAYGSGPIRDECGSNVYGTVTGGLPTGDILPRIAFRRGF